MRTLIVTRHAKALRPTEGQSDISRELSDKSSKYFKKIAKELRKKDLEPDLIVTSPAVRASETANKLVEKFDKEIPVLTWNPLYNDATNDLFDFIDEKASDKEVVMITGHNPILPILIKRLTGKSLDNFPTLATAVLKFDVEKWSDVKNTSGKLKKVLIPKEI